MDTPQKRYKKRLAARGIKQLNVLAPVHLHPTIKAIANGEKPQALIAAEEHIARLESALKKMRFYAKIGHKVVTLTGVKRTIVHAILKIEEAKQ